MTNPFQADSAIAKAFDLAVKGTTRDAINKLCEKANIGNARVFWVLRRNQYGETKWQYQQDNEGNVKLVVASKAAAAKKATKAPVKKTTNPAAKKKAAPKKATVKKTAPAPVEAPIAEAAA